MKTMRSLLIGLAVLALAGSAFAQTVPYTGRPYEHDGVTVNTDRVLHRYGKLWVKLIVINGTDKLLLVDKNQIQAKLPDGRALSRALSLFATRGHPHAIAPGLSHPLWVEYKIDLPLEVKLDFAHGFLLAGKPLPLPEYVVSPGR
jgi:hypothetical protein